MPGLKTGSSIVQPSRFFNPFYIHDYELALEKQTSCGWLLSMSQRQAKENVDSAQWQSDIAILAVVHLAIGRRAGEGQIQHWADIGPMAVAHADRSRQ